MNLLFIAKPLSKKGNGVVSAIQTEFKYLQKKENVALYNLGVELEDDIASVVFSVSKYKSISDLPKPFDKPDLVVFEEVYKIEYITLYNECLKNEIPYIIIPHGCLVSIAQNSKKLKHIIANVLLFNRFIRKAQAVEFLNENEKNNSKFRYKKGIIIPNSVEYRKRQYKRDEKIFKFIYIGRYDVITKGLDLLINTFISLKDWCNKNNVILELFGPLEDNVALSLLKDRIIENNCEKNIIINGPIYNEEKQRALEEASVFIQTSRHEGQPMGIMEALSLGLPCLVTNETTFGDYCNKNNCGIGVDFDENKLKEAIYDIYNNRNKLDILSNNAIESIKKDYEIKVVTDLRIKKYKNIINSYKM